VATTRAPFSLVDPELREVERELAVTALPDDRLMGPLLSMVLPGQGKRFRPALALLACRAGTPGRREMVDMAVGVELLHAASLVHDDVVDESSTRRGEATLFTRVGNAVAVLVGDYLFAQSAARCVGTGDLRVIGLFASTLGLMVQGQIEEASRGSQPHLTVTRDDYFQTIWGKTASLFVLACEGGAILAGISETQIQALRNYGRCVGLAFQVIDDILDYVGEESVLGKPVGGDLRQGTVTLPLIYQRDSMPNDLFDRLFIEQDIDELLARVRSGNAIERSYEDAALQVERARQSLALLDDSPVRDALDEIATLTLRRAS
jgi:geranylgeranyl pyrophosphate synthase